MATGGPALARRLLAEAVGTGAAGHGRRRLRHRRHEPDPRRRGAAAVLQLDRDRLRADRADPDVRAGVGAHFNPVVSAADWWLGRRAGTGLAGREVGAYTVAQTVGAIAGAVLANVMFDVPTTLSTHDRSDWHLWVGEVVATAGLVALIFALARTGRGAWAAPAVGAYIGAAYWFTSSTSFANPSVTVGRMFSDTFAGIEPARCRGSCSRSSSAPRSVSGWSGRCTRTWPPPTTSSYPRTVRPPSTHRSTAAGRPRSSTPARATAAGRAAEC